MPSFLDAVLGFSGLIASVALVLLNGLFVAAEFAIVKVRRTRLEELAGQGISSARISILCVDRLDEYLSATQLGITVSSLALGWIGEEAFSTLLSSVGHGMFELAPGTRHLVATVLSFFFITLLHVVLGELVPKRIAIQNAEKTILWVSRPLRAFYLFTRPLIRFFGKLADFALRVFGYRTVEEAPISEQELKLVMEDSKQDGVISESEAQIISRAFEFSDKRVGDIMVPIERVQFISSARPLEENLATVRTRMHTRFPLCDSDFNTVKGIVHMKDVWPQLLQQLSNEAFGKCSRAPIFVESNLRQDQLLKLFQSCRAHMAVVQDPRTRTNVGIVTLEDVLEGIVGEIRDEHGN